MTIASTPIAPLAEIPIDPHVAALPKADLHIHQEWRPRLERVLARRAGRAPYDWRSWTARMMAETPPGLVRLERLGTGLPAAQAADTDDRNFVPRVENLLDERHPRFRAEAIGYLDVAGDPGQLHEAERWLAACLQAGLAGVDLRTTPYDTEADPALWATAYRWAARAAEAGLGITAHAGEFSAANLAAALRVPGLTRIGHAVYAAGDPYLLELLAQRGVTVECSLTCNVVLGAVPSYAEHPIRRFVEHGIPVALGTDNPVQVCTTIGREYAAAHALGFTTGELLAFTRNAVRAAFTTSERRDELLRELDVWEGACLT